MSDEVRSVSSTGGEKGTKIEKFDLIPTGPLTELASHYGVGSKKYADHNWRRGYEWSKSYAALSRHLTAFWGGEDIDPETGSKHIIAVAWHAFALAEFMEVFPEFDDRFVYVKKEEPAATTEQLMEVFDSIDSDNVSSHAQYREIFNSRLKELLEK